MLSEPTEFHRIADHVDAVHAGEYQRENDRRHVLDAVAELRFAGHLNSPRLLGVLDFCKIILHIRNLPERNRHGVTDLVADTNTV